MERETRAVRQMTDSPMLRLFREGATNYQPAVKGVNGLAPETGEPKVSFENVCRILAAGLLIRKILVNPTGALVLFKGGAQFYAPGLRIGIEGAATAALARVAEKAGFGEREELFHFYRDLPADWNEDLPDLKPNTLPPSIRADLRELAREDARTAMFV